MAFYGSGWILTGTGYEADIVQNSLARLGIRLLIGPVTALFFVAAAVLLVFYPLNESRYAELQERIKVMEKERKIQPGS